MTMLVYFRRVCPIHVHFLLAISTDAVLVCPPPDFFVCGLSCHLVFKMNLLMNVCSIQVVVLVTLHVSEPYSSTLFMLVLKILILFRAERDLTRLPSQTTSFRWQVDKEVIDLSRAKQFYHLCVARSSNICQFYF